MKELLILKPKNFKQTEGMFFFVIASIAKQSRYLDCHVAFQAPRNDDLLSKSQKQLKQTHE